MRKDQLFTRRDFLKVAILGGLAACSPIDPNSPSFDPISTEISPTLVPFPKIEPLYEKDIKVFLDNCQNCKGLGITMETVAGGYFEGDFLFHSKDKNDADYFYLNQVTSFEPLNWESTDSEFALVPKASEGDIYTGLKYFIWNPNVTDDNGNIIVTYQPDGTPNSAQKFILPSNNDIEPRLKRARFIVPEISPESLLPKKYTQDEINQMTPAEILAQAPELEGHEKWRAAGKYAMYLNAEGQVEKAYDMTIGEYRDIPDYPATTIDNFREGEIDPDDLFNGNYFLYLEKEAKNLSCSPNMRTDIKLEHTMDRNLILPTISTTPNFTQEGSEFFIRDHVAHFTKLSLEDGSEVLYAIMPLFMCNLQDRTNVYPIITVNSSYDPNNQEKHNSLFMAGNRPVWLEKMNTTPIIAGSQITYPGLVGLQDPLVSKTFEEILDMPERFEKFINNDLEALSEPSIVVLNFIATSPTNPQMFK